MALSYADKIQVNCPACYQDFVGDLWLIIDRVERADLIKHVQGDTVNILVCPSCKQNLGQVVTPLLIYQPNLEGPLLLVADTQMPIENLQGMSAPAFRNINAHVWRRI